MFLCFVHTASLYFGRHSYDAGPGKKTRHHTGVGLRPILRLRRWAPGLQRKEKQTGVGPGGNGAVNVQRLRLRAEGGVFGPPRTTCGKGKTQGDRPPGA